MKTTTKCVHSGTYVDPATRGINTPIFTSSSSQYIGTEVRLYPRYFNVPNQRAVVEKLADLEGCEDGILFSSGMAAISSVMMSFLKPGDHAVIQDDIYGGAHGPQNSPEPWRQSQRAVVLSARTQPEDLVAARAASD